LIRREVRQVSGTRPSRGWGELELHDEIACFSHSAVQRDVMVGAMYRSSSAEQDIPATVPFHRGFQRGPERSLKLPDIGRRVQRRRFQRFRPPKSRWNSVVHVVGQFRRTASCQPHRGKTIDRRPGLGSRVSHQLLAPTGVQKLLRGTANNSQKASPAFNLFLPPLRLPRPLPLTLLFCSGRILRWTGRTEAALAAPEPSSPDQDRPEASRSPILRQPRKPWPTSLQCHTTAS
jgi:hypothetical protein